MDSFETRELSEAITLPVGVIKGAEFLQENITLSVESSPNSKRIYTSILLSGKLW